MKKLLIHANGHLSIVGEGIDIVFKGTKFVSQPLPDGVNSLEGLETEGVGGLVIVRKDGVEVARADFN